MSVIDNSALIIVLTNHLNGLKIFCGMCMYVCCALSFPFDSTLQLGQSFECPSVIHLSKYSDSRLTSVSTVPAATTASGTSNRSSPQTNDRYPLIIRMERRSATAIENGDKLPEPPGSALPSWVQAQTTYCVLEKIAISSSSSTPAPSSSKRFKYNVKCVKQKIVVEGVSYELKEIYGIEKTMGNRVNAVSGNSVNGSKANGNSGSAQGDGSGENGTDASIDPAIDNDDGAECVICLSEPKTTTVFPCRYDMGSVDWEYDHFVLLHKFFKLACC